MLEAGRYDFRKQVSMMDKKNMTIRGEGPGQTILSFKNQTAGGSGAEGLLFKNIDGLTVADLRVEDTKGDGIKIQDSKRVTLREVHTVWTNGGKTENGAYGLYPVTSEHVLIEDCYASGSSDAGIYVGQTKHAVIRRCSVDNNVTGIEVENTWHADVYENKVTQNTAGILIFDLPEIPQKDGHSIRVFNNHIHNNNHPNFGAPGNIVSLVPAGMGMLVMACHDVEVFHNRIQGHKSMGMAISSYLITEKTFDDPQYNPYPYRVYVHDNTFQRPERMQPDTETPIGQKIAMVVKKSGVQMDILYDGVINPDHAGPGKQLKPKFKICLGGNQDAVVFDLSKMTTSSAPFACKHAPLEPVKLKHTD
jgi:parallel beta-helix repeat protein